MTPKTFKRRWETDNPPITYEDIAKCAKDWHLFSIPKIMPVDTVIRAVCKHAGVSLEEELEVEE